MGAGPIFLPLVTGSTRNQRSRIPRVPHSNWLQAGKSDIVTFEDRQVGDHRSGIPMASSNAHDPPGAGSSDDLTGLKILVVEDSWNVGKAIRDLLELLGADVAGPAATMGEAEHLLSECAPDVALVDFHLRGGEPSYALIARLHEQGVPVIILSGSFEFPPLPSVEGATFLVKPVSEAELLANLRPLVAKKATR